MKFEIYGHGIPASSACVFLRLYTLDNQADERHVPKKVF